MGYDANSLYLSAIMQEMPTLNPIRRRKENGFKAEVTDRYGVQAHEWLTLLSHQNNIHIRHKFNGVEKRLGNRRVPVDGWDAENKTVYQFQGCWFHGHSCAVTRHATHNTMTDTLFGTLQERTANIKAYLTETLNLKVVEMRECEWKQFKLEHPEHRSFFKEHCPKTKSPFHYNGQSVTVDSVVSAIQSGKLFGFVECDLRVPKDKEDFFSEFQPIFKNTLVGREDVGEHMKEYAESHDLLKQPRRTLVASYWAKKILLATPLLKWYVEHGLVVEDIHEVIEYTPKACFDEFGQFTSNCRRQADVDPSKNILAQSAKLMGNSSYGRTVTNVSKFKEVSYLPTDKAAKLINDPRFKAVRTLTDTLDEVEMSPKKLVWDLPLEIGVMVYNMAKVRMLQFYYDCLDKYISRDHFQLAEGDTDSLYLALSTENLEEAVKPELREEFYRNYHLWFPALSCDKHCDEFVGCKTQPGSEWVLSEQSKCCQDRHAFDKRTPGLFKLEYQGSDMVCLCSKTYFASGTTQKMSSKGLQAKSNKLSYTDFVNVLTSKESGSGVNRGFRTDGKVILTYLQRRRSLSYLYIKRIVDKDGVTTYPTRL